MSDEEQKTVVVSVRMDVGLLESIDDEAARDRRSRNALIVQVLEDWILALPVAQVVKGERGDGKIATLGEPIGPVSSVLTPRVGLSPEKNANGGHDSKTCRNRFCLICKLKKEEK